MLLSCDPRRFSVLYFTISTCRSLGICKLHFTAVLTAFSQNTASLIHWPPWPPLFLTQLPLLGPRTPTIPRFLFPRMTRLLRLLPFLLLPAASISRVASTSMQRSLTIRITGLNVPKLYMSGLAWIPALTLRLVDSRSFYHHYSKILTCRCSCQYSFSSRICLLVPFCDLPKLHLAWYWRTASSCPTISYP
ncbi:uncharacterized protein K441DRAFT_183287 [Cenococcum geophilum 1.58]|uniref:uncharacterized protein n=1 Tax=Cenococcum geophilum 1.58 TaxID=794803 RepID=UPI003590166F|nr:hypothetical protein K441DRAFT_183287 [Cenococcum geophilum 1.58]